MSLSWTQPCCSRCWRKNHPDRIPVRLTDESGFESAVEVCAWCGDETVDGIYAKVDPRTVPYPKEEE